MWKADADQGDGQRADGEALPQARTVVAGGGHPAVRALEPAHEDGRDQRADDAGHHGTDDGSDQAEPGAQDGGGRGGHGAGDDGGIGQGRAVLFRHVLGGTNQTRPGLPDRDVSPPTTGDRGQRRAYVAIETPT